MSFKITSLCRTTGRISDLDIKIDEKTKQERKSIYFTVVSDRPYKSKRIENGKIIEERQSDYIFCKATGVIAELIEKHCKQDSGKKTKGDNPKPIYVSRQLLLSGHLETYPNTMLVELKKSLSLSLLDENLDQAKIGLKDENAQSPSSVVLSRQSSKKATLIFKKKQEYKDFIFIVHDLEFAGSKEGGKSSTTLLGNEEEISIQLEDDVSTSFSTDNGNSNRNGNKENISANNTDTETANKENKIINENIEVGDGDIELAENMFNGDMIDGSAPF